jgi:hypothetical protein
MNFTYRLARRLAQTQIALIAALALGCSDAQDPNFASTAEDSSIAVTPEHVVLANNSSCSNQPTGLNPITDNSFNVLPPYTLPGGGSLGWRTYHGSSRVKIKTDAQAPRSSAPIAEGLFPKGQHGGGAPFNIGIRFKKVKTLYWCVWQWLSPNFTNNGNTGTKWGFIITPYGTGSQRVNHYFNLAQNLGINLQSAGATLNRNMYTPYNMIQNAGQWHRFEFLVVANTQGKSDGIARVWVDGTIRLDQNNVRYFFPNQAPAFNGLSWNPTYGGGNNPVPYDMFQKIDHWFVSGK